MPEIKEMLLELRDEKYKSFSASLMPTVDKEKVIGVRTPILRKLAKELKKEDRAADFLQTLPHEYYEENNLHAFLICEMRDFGECAEAVDKFLPFIDNWATCDSLKPPAFKKNPQKLLPYIEKWLSSDDTYTVRFGIGALMSWFLDENFKNWMPEKISRIKSEEYYINMMIAWYFATALAKRWDDIFPFIKENRLGLWVHNKAIQKSIESFRITEKQKAILKALKRR